MWIWLPQTQSLCVLLLTVWKQKYDTVRQQPQRNRRHTITYIHIHTPNEQAPWKHNNEFFFFIYIAQIRGEYSWTYDELHVSIHIFFCLVMACLCVFAPNQFKRVWFFFSLFLSLVLKGSCDHEVVYGSFNLRNIVNYTMTVLVPKKKKTICFWYLRSSIVFHHFLIFFFVEMNRYRFEWLIFGSCVYCLVNKEHRWCHWYVVVRMCVASIFFGIHHTLTYTQARTHMWT